MIIQAYIPRFGGAEKQLAAILPFLRARGVEPVILTRRYPGLAPFEVIDETPVYRLPIPGPKAMAALFFTVSALLRLRQIRPDVIHAHEMLSPATIAAAAKRLFKIPAIVNPHRGGMLGDIDKLSHRTGGKARLQELKRQVDGWIVISKQIDQELADSGIPERTRHLIPNGVEPQLFSPASAQEKRIIRKQLLMDPGAPIVIFSGRLVAEKRVDVLLQAWDELHSQAGDAQLWIVGTGPQEQSLRRKAGENVHFSGYVKDTAPYLRAADIFVLPSSTEGLSVAMLEAMACGLACVLSDVGGARDVIEPGKNGLLVDPDFRL